MSVLLAELNKAFPHKTLNDAVCCGKADAALLREIGEPPTVLPSRRNQLEQFHAPLDALRAGTVGARSSLHGRFGWRRQTREHW